MKLPYVTNRAVMAVAIALAVLIGGLPAMSAVAQASTTSYTSVLSGDVVTTSGGWTIDMESTGAENSIETVAVFGQANGVLISWMQPGTDLNAARDLMLGQYSSLFDTVIPVDKGSYGDVSYSLDIGNAEGIEFGLFSLFLGQRPSGYVEYYLYMGPVSSFTYGFASAQQNITVGGKRIFQDVDGAGLQDFLNDHAGAAGGTVSEPDENVLEDEANNGETPAPTATSEGTESSEGAAYIEALQGEVDYLQGSLDDFLVNFAGLQDENGDAAVNEINRISSEWLKYPDRAATIVAPAGFEDIDASYRTLATDVETLGTDWRNFVSLLQSGGNTDQAIDVFVADMNTVQTGLDDLSVMLEAQSTGGAAETVETPIPTEPAPTATEVVVPTEPAPTAEPTTISTKGTIGGNESETGLGGSTRDNTDDQAGISGDYADLGLVTDGDYVSPQTGVEITWDETWYFDEAYDEPISSDTSAGIDSVTISWVTDPSVSIFLSVGTSQGLVPQDFGDLWISPDFLAENADPSAEVLANETSRSGAVSVLMRDYLDDGTEIIVMRSVACGEAACDTLVLTTMIGLPGSFSDAYQDARSGLNVSGARLLDAMTPRAVSTALDT